MDYEKYLYEWLLTEEISSYEYKFKNGMLVVYTQKHPKPLRLENFMQMLKDNPMVKGVTIKQRGVSFDINIERQYLQ